MVTAAFNHQSASVPKVLIQHCGKRYQWRDKEACTQEFWGYDGFCGGPSHVSPAYDLGLEQRVCGAERNCVEAGLLTFG